MAIRLVEERQWLPLAVVVAVGLLYPFARPSLRAAFAFVAGITSLVGSLLAILDAHWNGFAARQLPAFALVAAGIALLAAAVIALRSKPTVSGGRRVARWILTPAATILLVYYVVVAIGAALWSPASRASPSLRSRCRTKRCRSGRPTASPPEPRSP